MKVSVTDLILCLLFFRGLGVPLKKGMVVWRWFTPGIPGTWKAEVGPVLGQPGKKISKTLSQQTWWFIPTIPDS
jgi:hypothetical protein